MMTFWDYHEIGVVTFPFLTAVCFFHPYYLLITFIVACEYICFQLNYGT